jgi:flagellar protein FliO/FliZ
MLTMLFRLVFSLALVLGLMALLGRFLRARQLGGVIGASRQRGVEIRVLGRHGLGRSTSVTVVKVGHQVLLLGVTESAVTVLRELTDDEFEQEEPAPGGPAQTGTARPPTLAAVLAAARERTTRRG